MSVAEPHVQSILLGDAIEHAPAAVLVADDLGRCVAANSYACRMLGYEREELLELIVADIALYPEVELMGRDQATETAILRRKDGTELAFVYRAGETKVASMTYYVAVGWPAE